MFVKPPFILFGCFLYAIFGAADVLVGSPPEAPEGFRWENVETLSDDFDGTKLDSSKWHDHNPDWIGRPPGKFLPSAVRVGDGFLKISCTTLEKPDGKFTIACGTVQSKSRNALYGYYECRMKASQLSTSSNFWMVGNDIKVPGGTVGIELIVQFTIGNAAGFQEHMKSNAMISFKSSEQGSRRKKAKVTDRVELSSGVADDFHTYGVWWVDENTLKFYADGDYVYTINPSTEFDDKPFRQPLSVNLVCETFDWQPLPTKDELADANRNTAYFDYVRAYRLVKDR